MKTSDRLVTALWTRPTGGTSLVKLLMTMGDAPHSIHAQLLNGTGWYVTVPLKELSDFRDEQP